MHDNGVLHCDLKPNNIFSEANISSFRLGDFGLSKLKWEKEPYKCSRGSIYFIAPEVNKATIDEADSGKYDMYGVGMMMAYVEQKKDLKCDVFTENEKSLDKRYTNYDEFYSYVDGCLAADNSEQSALKQVILGLLLKDESKRFNEEKSIDLLNNIINEGKAKAKELVM